MPTPQQHVPVIIGKSKKTEAMIEFAQSAAKSGDNILLQGETGAGKDRLAAYVHYLSSQSGAFVAINCGALPADLMESELFGHRIGAFTNAREPKQGLVEMADKGTLFLNEIDTVPLHLQPKLLHLLERGSYRQVGSVREMQVNARLIAATNANMESAVRQGRIRMDYYYRLNELSFVVPPLRERRDDIPELTDYFIEEKLKEKPEQKKLSQEAMSIMLVYGWPGNVRELRTTIRRAITTSAEEEISVKYVEPHLKGVCLAKGAASSSESPENKGDLPTFYELQKNYFRRLLEHTGGNMVAAAGVAGIARSALYTRLASFGLKSSINDSRKKD